MTRHSWAGIKSPQFVPRLFDYTKMDTALDCVIWQDNVQKEISSIFQQFLIIQILFSIH